MPKTNKPLVRDGRIQAPKKRTDRSYLAPASAAPTIAPVEDLAETEAAAASEAEAPEVAVAPVAAVASPQLATAPASAPTGKLPTTVRALQQQGVRKRREVDLDALARRDTQYAYHELRRIAALATMVLVTLIILYFVLR